MLGVSFIQSFGLFFNGLMFVCLLYLLIAEINLTPEFFNLAQSVETRWFLQAVSTFRTKIPCWCFPFDSQNAL